MIQTRRLVILLLAISFAEQSNALNMDMLIDGKPVNSADSSILQAGKQFQIGFNITNAKNNTPVSNLHPGAWIRARTAGRKSCDNAVRNYLAQGSNANQDISLNGYTFITLNKDQSIAVMDPRLNLATSNLLSLTQLNTMVGDWQLSENKQVLYVTLPDEKALVEINPLTAKITKKIVLQQKPMGMAVFKQHPVIWIASKQGGVLYAIDTKKLTLLKQFKIGKGAVILVRDLKNQRLFAYSKDDGQLVGIDVKNQKIISRIETQQGLTALDYSPLVNRIFMAHPEFNYLISHEPQTSAETEKIILAANGHGVKITPDEHWVLAFNGNNGVINIIDINTGEMSHVLQFKHPFDQIVFSKHYAYIRHTDNANVSLIHLPTLQAGVDPGLIEVPFGASAPNMVGDLPSLSPIAMLPSEHGVVVANPADRTIFLFMEGGMKAPMNAFKTWTATPLSIIVHDHSLKETQTGLYETLSMVARPGKYEVVFYLPKQSQTHCLPLDIAASKVTNIKSKLPIQHKIDIYTKNIVAGRSIEFEINIQNLQGEDSQTDDVKILLLRPGSNWLHRTFAKPLKNGNYVFNIIFPEAGKYKLLVKSNQLQLNIDQKNLKTITVTPPDSIP